MALAKGGGYSNYQYIVNKGIHTSQPDIKEGELYNLIVQSASL